MNRAVEIALLVVLVAGFAVLGAALFGGVLQMGGDPSCALQGVC